MDHKREGHSFALIISAVIFAILSSTSNATLYVIKDAPTLRSSDFPLIGNTESIDVLWLFDHSVRLSLNKFHLNGHAGDFVLVSDQPLLKPDLFQNGTSEDVYIDNLANSILTDQGLLISWKTNKTIEAVNRKGTFVLFHSEPKDPAWTGKFDGFEIVVQNYDVVTATTTTPAPDPVIAPSDQESYITKYLDCKEPSKFLKELNDFKTKIAAIATEFCTEFQVLECLDQGAISFNEVNIPGPNEENYAGLHYCDVTWPNYDTCVEVTFAITRINSEGMYVLPSNQLERMWKEKSQDLVQYNYCPYDPPATAIDLNTVGWMIFLLGIIILITITLGAAWVKITTDLLSTRKASAENPIKQIKKFKEMNEDKKPRTTYDSRNPVYDAVNRENEPMYPSGDYLRVEDAASSTTYKKRSTDNPTFQNVDADVYAYDNTGFDQEGNDVFYDPVNRNINGNEDPETLVMRSSWSHRASDTEI